MFSTDKTIAPPFKWRSYCFIGTKCK